MQREAHPRHHPGLDPAGHAAGSIGSQDGPANVTLRQHQPRRRTIIPQRYPRAIPHYDALHPLPHLDALPPHFHTFSAYCNAQQTFVSYLTHLLQQGNGDNAFEFRTQAVSEQNLEPGISQLALRERDKWIKSIPHGCRVW